MRQVSVTAEVPARMRVDLHVRAVASVQRVTLDHARVVGSLDDLEAED